MEPGDVLRLLVVEESLNEAEVLISVLRNAGHAVRPTQVQDAEGLHETLESQHFDIIMCATGLEGCSIAQAIDAVARTGKDVPVIAVGDRANEADLIEAMEAGARDFVSSENPQHLQLVVARELENLNHRRALRRCEQASRESEKRCRALLDSSRDAITYVHEGMHIYANPVYLEMFGFTDPEEIEGTPIMDMVAPEDHAKFKDFLRRYSKGEDTSSRLEVKGLRANGSTFDALMEFTPATIDDEPCTQIIIRDQSINSELEKKLKYLSKQDLLSGLYNRQYFLEELEQAVSEALSGTTTAAVLYLELDNFKNIKESVGIAGSDLVLADIATLVKKKVDESQVAARFADNVFTVLARDLRVQEAEEQAEALRRAVEDHISDVGGQSVGTTCSIGISLVTESAPSAQEVLSRAELACGVARSRGGNRVHLHNPVADEQAGRERDHRWQERVQAALENDGFRLVYQPIVSLHGDPGEKYEVLLRMVGEDGEDILPGQFLPSAAKGGLMPAVDRWVIAHAVKTLAQRRRKGNETLFFIKISGATLADETLLPWIAEQIKSARLHGDSLVFEVAESEAVTHLKETKTFAKGLKELRCGLALDHFGNGLNSFHLLKHLPVDYLKIDGSFIHNLASNPENQSMVKSITEMAHSMGKLTIAEFVEDANSLAVLWQCGVNFIQGHFLQEPHEVMEYDFEGDTE